MTTPKLGQHFLTDDSVVADIVAAALLVSGETVLEVGPGNGVLTKALLAAGAKVVAVEKDGELHYKLKKKFNHDPNLNLILGDIRNFELTSLPRRYKFVANIPYYLTGNLVQNFLTSPNPPSLAVLMLQKEVAERITAPAGQSSLLQLTSLVFAEMEVAKIVPKEKFSPPPKVDSAVVVFKIRRQPLLDKEDQKVFFRLLKFAFAGKRKKLTNTLSGALRLTAKQIETALADCSVSANARPQELDVYKWICLYKSLISEGLI